jgi:hypothetical protein
MLGLLAVSEFGLCSHCQKAAAPVIRKHMKAIRTALVSLNGEMKRPIVTKRAALVMEHFKVLDAYRSRGVLGLDAIDVAAKFVRSLGLERDLAQLAAEAELWKNLPARADLVEIWQTMDDGGSCSKCAQNHGLTRDDLKAPAVVSAPGGTIEVQREQDIPALCVQEDGVEFGYPGSAICRCFWRAVPRSFYELLKRDPEAARKLDAAGKVEDVLLVRDKVGEIMAEARIRFDE